jgi:hypothetical protein
MAQTIELRAPVLPVLVILTAAPVAGIADPGLIRRKQDGTRFLLALTRTWFLGYRSAGCWPKPVFFVTSTPPGNLSMDSMPAIFRFLIH